MLRSIGLFGLRVVLLLALLGLPYAPLATPSAAAPAIDTFVVGNLADTSGLDCLTPANCTLRSAIEQANATGTNKNIRFAPSWAGSTNVIAVNSPLPAITKDGTWIDGTTADTTPAPIDVVLDGQLDSGVMISVTASYVTLSNLKFSNGGPVAPMVELATGKGNQVAFNRFSSYYNSDGPCSSHVRNPRAAIWVDAGVSGTSGDGNGSAYIYGNFFGCATDTAINIQGSYTYVGETAAATSTGNYFGNDDVGHPMTNTNAVSISGSNNVVDYNQIVRNNQGVLLWNNASSNVVMTNTIRLNAGTGVVLAGGANFNRIGSALGGPTSLGNVVGGNVDGIGIEGSTTHDNFILGNKIGTNATGTAADPNTGNGITIKLSAHDNFIGNTAADGNLISGNWGDGVQVTGGAHDNVIAGNMIGADIFNSVNNLPNGQSGVALFNGAVQNTVGGSNGANGNLIKGNLGNGVYMAGSGTLSNTVKYNGINYNRSDGVTLQQGTHGTLIALNLVAYGSASGMYLTGGASTNTLEGNNVLQNAFYGVLLDGSNTSANRIAFGAYHDNGYDGIGERNSAANNIWTHISTYNNGGLGIDKFASSDATNTVDPPFPVISTTVFAGGTGTVTGSADRTYFNSALDNATVTVELYSVATDPSGFGEGQTYLGSATTNADGSWQVTFGATASGCYTAFETVQGVAVVVPLSFSTEFGPDSCRVLLPLIAN